MRFFSSSALASAEKLRLAASCSAAETMRAKSPLSRQGRARFAHPRLRPQVEIVDARHKSRPGSLSGRLLARLHLGSEDFNRTARLFYGGDRRFRRAKDGKRDFRLDFAGSEQPHAVLGAAQHPGFDQSRGVDLAGRVERAGIDGRLDASEIHLVELEGEFRILKAAFGQPAMQRHLAAFKALDAHAGARGLTLAAAAAGLALARPDAAADALAGLAGARTAGKVVKLHGYFSTTSTR